jgi:hypothetical protein
METPHQQITPITLYFQVLTKSTSTLLHNRGRGHRLLSALAQEAVPGFATRIHYSDSSSTSLVIGSWTWRQQYDRFIRPISSAENTTTANISLDKFDRKNRWYWTRISWNIVSTGGCSNLLQSHFLISGTGEAEQRRGPNEFRTSQDWIFFFGIDYKPTLRKENLRLINAR